MAHRRRAGNGHIVGEREGRAGAGADVIDGKGGFDQLTGGNDADTINASGDLFADLVDCGEGFTNLDTGNFFRTLIGTDTDTANPTTARAPPSPANRA